MLYAVSALAEGAFTVSIVATERAAASVSVRRRRHEGRAETGRVAAV